VPSNGKLFQLLKNDRYFYAVGQLFLLGVSFLFNLVAAKLLGPEQMGVWTSISLVSIYGMVLTLGIINGMGRDVPYYRGNGDSREVDRTIATAIVWLVAVSALFLLATLLLYRFLPDAQRTIVMFGLLLLCARIVNAFSTILIRSFRDFRRLGWHQALIGLIMLATIIPLWSQPRLAVIYAGVYLSLIAGMLLSHRFVVYRPFSILTLQRLLKTGFPIYIVGLMFILLTSIDRVIVLGYLGTAQLGLYTLGSTAIAVLMMVPSLVSNVMYPRLAEHYGATGDVSKLVPLVRRMIHLNLLLTMPVALLFLLSFYFYIVPVYLDAYTEGRNAMAIVMIAVLFLPAGMGFGDFFNVVGKQNVYLRNVLGGLLVNVSAGVLLVGRAGMGLEGAAIATVGGLLVFTLLQVGTYMNLFSACRVVSE
jgi:O-antigen/teichoic acid export membrane protein